MPGFGTSSPLEHLSPKGQELFADSTVEAERSVSECHLTVDIEDLRIFCWRYCLDRQWSRRGVECLMK
ncbi:Uncharacterised protein [Cedecea davisae]|nr:Uncharacterised protein [Cedecea davisae]